MRRARALLGHAVASLGRRAGRNAALAAGLAFLTALVSAVSLLTLSLREEATRAVEAMPDLVVQRTVAGRPALIEAAAAAAVAALPAVRRVEPRTWGYLFLPSLPGNVTLVGVDAAAPGDVAAALEPGGALPARGQAVLGAELARRLAVRPGDEVGLPPPDPAALIAFFEVVGTFRAESALFTADAVLLHPEDARGLLGVPAGSATDLAVTLTTAREAEVLTEKIAALLPGARVVDRRRVDRLYALTFGARGGLVSAMLLPALAAFLLLAWDRLTGLDVLERQEIGTLKAVGWSTGDVLAARLWESGLVALFGAAAGLLLGYVYVYGAGAPGLAGALLGWSALHPPFRLVPVLDATLLFTLLGSVVVPFVAASLVPAWRAAMRDPDDLLRAG